MWSSYVVGRFSNSKTQASRYLSGNVYINTTYFLVHNFGLYAFIISILCFFYRIFRTLSSIDSLIQTNLSTNQLISLICFQNNLNSEWIKMALSVFHSFMVMTHVCLFVYLFVVISELVDQLISFSLYFSRSQECLQNM